MTKKPDYGERLKFTPLSAPEPRPMSTVTTLLDKNASVAHVQVNKHSNEYGAGPRYNFKVSGSSKREQGDVYDEDTGEILALAKAFQKLSQEMFSEASRRVEALADEQEKSLVRSAERKLRKEQPVRRRTREEWEEWEAVKEAARTEWETTVVTSVEGGGGGAVGDNTILGGGGGGIPGWQAGHPREEWADWGKMIDWGNKVISTNEGNSRPVPPDAPAPRRIHLANGQLLVIHPNRVEFQSRGITIRTIDRT